MAGLPQNTTGIEFTVGTGAFFPLGSTSATSTSSATDASAASVIAGVGSAYPLSPTAGQSFYRTDLGHLFVFDGVAWRQA